MTCWHCRVRGRVQGVWYRASSREQALHLGLCGSATNRSDGSVELLLCGEETALHAMREWLWQGPELSQVEQVECEVVAEVPGIEGFTTA